MSSVLCDNKMSTVNRVDGMYNLSCFEIVVINAKTAIGSVEVLFDLQICIFDRMNAIELLFPYFSRQTASTHPKKEKKKTH